MVPELHRSNANLAARRSLSAHDPDPSARELIVSFRFPLLPGVELGTSGTGGEATWRGSLPEVLSALLRRAPIEGSTVEVRLASPGQNSAGAGDHQRGVFRRDGDTWIFQYGVESARVRHSRGFSILAHLLRSPGQGLDVRLLDALSPTRGGFADALPAGGPRDRETLPGGLCDAGAILDTRALFEYRRRLAELGEEQTNAERHGDAGRAEHARREIEVISEQLRSAVGLGGRPRRACSEVERLRVSITRRIRVAIGEIRRHVPALGQHLAASVRTGSDCTYQPRGTQQIEWDL